MADEEQVFIHPEHRNLAEDLDEKELGEIAGSVVEKYKIDEESRQGWMEDHANWLKLYFQKDAPLNAPWEGSSDESVPMMAEACNQFHARAYQAMFPSRKIIKSIPIGKPDPQSRERAERISTHMSWQLIDVDERYKPDKDALLLSLPAHGSFFTKTYRCPIRNRNITENVRAVDLCVPYGTGPRHIEDIERKTHILWMPLNKAKNKAAQGFFIKDPEEFGNRTKDEGKSEQDIAHDEVQGFSDTNYANADYAKILEQHTLLDLDGDGLSEPYIVWVDAQSEECLRISIRYDTDDAGEPTNDKEPVEYFTHYEFLRNPDGFYGLGFGHLLGQINIAVNKLLRQSVDAGTLQNVGNASGFVSKSLGIKKGELQFELGKFVATESSAEDIAKGIFQLKFPGPSATLFNVIEMLMKLGQRLATVTEAITGQTEKVMQPTTIMALIEQSLQVFSTVYERVLTAWACELKKHYRLNRKFMDEDEYFTVLDITGEMKEGFVAKDDYAPDHKVTPIADPKMSTEKQKLAKAEAELQASVQNPLIINSPIHLYNAFRRYYEAIGVEAIDEIMPKPQEQQMPRVDDPFQENVGALSPVPMVPPAFPDQDHELHIRAHRQLLNDPTYGSMLSQYGIQELTEHIQAHAAMLYGQTEEEDDSLGLIGALGGMGGMAAPPGNGGIPAAPAGPLPAAGGVDIGSLLGTGQPPEGTV